jgi:5-formyltetrahydrofolate cyclo-ligase
MQDADIPVAKRALRAELRRIRREITADPVDRLARSRRIWAQIVSIADLGAHRLESETVRAQINAVMLFEGLATEPDTSGWFRWCRDHSIPVYGPEVDGVELRVMPGDVDPAELDVVVVPGLAFTPDGRRLGQGGGHYDRFLTRLRPDCVTIGACFAEQLVDDLPTEPHDTTVEHVATDASSDPQA